MVLAFPALTAGQVVRTAPSKFLLSTGTGSLSVSAVPSAMTFNLVSNRVAVSNSPVNVTTTWSNSTLGSTLTLYGYFASPSAALTGNQSAVPIPSSAVSGQMTTGLPTTYTPFTQTGPFGAGASSLALFSQTIAIAGASRTDALTLSIDLQGLPGLPADIYTGTLVIQAQVL